MRTHPLQPWIDGAIFAILHFVVSCFLFMAILAGGMSTVPEGPSIGLIVIAMIWLFPVWLLAWVGAFKTGLFVFVLLALNSCLWGYFGRVLIARLYRRER